MRVDQALTPQIRSQTEAFRGESRRNKIDAKGRVSIPAEFRRIIERNDDGRDAGTGANVGASLTICYGPRSQECLICYTANETAKIDQIILDNGGELDSIDLRKLAYMFQRKATRAQLDPNGRLHLTATLRDEARLEEAATFAGFGKYFEIWNPELYERFKERTETGLFGDAPAFEHTEFLTKVTS